MESSFKYEDCLLKHHVRRDGWLPMCLHRLREMRSAFTPSFNRRLRYFTFCAVGAVDVLMLDLARVITRSTTGRFDTVFFFDKTPELVAETEKRIPGAVGFPGEFVDVVMASDPEEGDPLDALAPLELADDTESTRKLQMTLSMRRKFIQSFPFDVVNLDLERYLFRPKDPLPGKLVNTMRKVFEWQKRPFICEKKRRHPVDGFTLMFTTRVGPENLDDDYRDMLRGYLNQNIENEPQLAELLTARAGVADVAQIERQNFELFFKLAIPKVLASILHEKDWYVEEDPGIKVYEFERVGEARSYRMLHVTMQVRRKQPPENKRAPAQDSPKARAAYREVVKKIFREGEILVAEENIDVDVLKADLERIKRRSRLYYKES